jgi:tripartite-type tricarboxylate transporter receptor subunit TctC
MSKKSILMNGFIVVLIMMTTALMGQATAATPAARQSAADFYKGKAVKIILPSNPGGTIDILTRIMVNYLPEVTGATWVVVNQAAGSGFVAANTFFNDTKPDGLTLHGNSYGKLWPPYLMDDPIVKYDITKYEYIGGLKGGPTVLGMNANGPYTTVNALKAGKGIKFSGRQPKSLLTLGTVLAIDILNLDAKVISGYPGTADAQMAVMQKETDGFATTGETMFRAERDKSIKCMFLIEAERDQSYPNWPSITEFAKLSERQKRMMGAIFPDGKAYMVPPGTPEDIKQFLMDSFAKVFANKVFQDQVEKASGDWLGVDSAKRLTEMTVAIKNSKGDMAAFDELVKKHVK